jgi:predicted amidohydrolase
MKVAAVQHDIVWEDPRANFERLAPMIESAAVAGARLVVLSEMFATGFTMDAERMAESPDGPTAQFLAEQAASHGVWVCGSVPERPSGGERPVNQFVLAAPDGSAHRMAKLHPFTFAGEHEHYAAGTTPITVDVEGVRVSPSVCYDLRFVDVYWDVAKQTDLYVIVANWPGLRVTAWNVMLQARAIENQAYVVGVNRVGSGGGSTYSGNSAIVDPWGEVLATASAVETVLIADIDPCVVADARRSFPALDDRRG